MEFLLQRRLSRVEIGDVVELRTRLGLRGSSRLRSMSYYDFNLQRMEFLLQRRLSGVEIGDVLEWRTRLGLRGSSRLRSMSYYDYAR